MTMVISSPARRPSLSRNCKLSHGQYSLVHDCETPREPASHPWRTLHVGLEKVMHSVPFSLRLPVSGSYMLAAGPLMRSSELDLVR
jgi:hypothetical protein